MDVFGLSDPSLSQTMYKVAKQVVVPSVMGAAYILKTAIPAEQHPCQLPRLPIALSEHGCPTQKGVCTWGQAYPGCLRLLQRDLCSVSRCCRLYADPSQGMTTAQVQQDAIVQLLCSITRTGNADCSVPFKLGLLLLLPFALSTMVEIIHSTARTRRSHPTVHPWCLTKTKKSASVQVDGKHVRCPPGRGA